MKILHTADWHLDAPMVGYPELKTQQLKLPDKITRLCQAENCDLLIIAGDLFDGVPSSATVTAVRSALSRLRIPVIIAPGNHDHCSPDSPYLTDQWPSNVHIFTEPQITSLSLPELDCRIYGAGYRAMECPGLLKNFRAEGGERWHIGVLHGEMSAGSSYCPITRLQLQESGLDYLAMGHIHKLGSVRAGDASCAWPGAPMGRGFDETGPKGVILVTLDAQVNANFVPLDTPRFYDEQVDVDTDAQKALECRLPALSTEDYYRITLTGYSDPLDPETLAAQFPHIPHLILRDETVPQVDLWSVTEEDTLEGAFFSLLKQAADSGSPSLSHRAQLAARISRRLLDGQEVILP